MNLCRPPREGGLVHRVRDPQHTACGIDMGDSWDVWTGAATEVDCERCLRSIDTDVPEIVMVPK